MPTTLPRYQVTETPELARALEVAARRWPEITSRAALIAALAEEGARTIQGDEEERIAERRALIDSLAGGFHFEPGYLVKLREDWPE